VNRNLNPATISPPVGRYSHAVEVSPNARWLYISGQVGIGPDGKLAEGFGAQVEQTWRNILAILEDAKMAMADVVKVTVFLTRDGDIAEYRAARDRIIGDHRPASTLVVISRLVRPEMLVEVEAVAAKG
jgi:2-iminobutanoate/2-iminopropanoate deaminase